jgi:hypothetical protein
MFGSKFKARRGGGGISGHNTVIHRQSREESGWFVGLNQGFSMAVHVILKQFAPFR